MFRVWLLLAVALGVARAEDPAKLVNPTDSYVADFANVLDDASKAQIQQICSQVHDKAGATIKVVTVNSLDGADLSDFSIRLAENWKVGAKGTDKGLIVLLAMKERQDRIEVGYGLEGVLNDAKVGDIRRSMHPQLAAGEYGPALLGGVQQLAADIAADAGVTLQQTPAVQLQPVRHRGQSSGLGSVIRILFFIFVLIMIFGSRRGGGGGGSGLGWFLLGNVLGSGGGGGRGDWGGGGFGGGDSGGGGGGDSGGGFGGGGAGGSW